MQAEQNHSLEIGSTLVHACGPNKFREQKRLKKMYWMCWCHWEWALQAHNVMHANGGIYICVLTFLAWEHKHIIIFWCDASISLNMRTSWITLSSARHPKYSIFIHYSFYSRKEKITQGKVRICCESSKHFLDLSTQQENFFSLITLVLIIRF